jgi:AcrR family transcriptional regulator
MSSIAVEDGRAGERAHEPRLRADAWRNRERIIAAAREAFIEHGAEVRLDDVARRAGVGNATLYRNFPDRAALLHHVVLSVMERVTVLAETVLVETADSFEALRRFVHDAADERFGAMCPMLTSHVDMCAPDLLQARERLERAVQHLLDEAHASGLLRTDVGVGDIMVPIGQLTRPLPGTGCLTNDRFVHRHLEIFLDGLHAPGWSVLPGTGLTIEDLRRPGLAPREDVPSSSREAMKPA